MRDVAARHADTVLIYDADCGFCRWCLGVGGRLLPWSPRAVGFQRVDVTRYGVTRERASEAIQLYRPGRTIQEGALAIAAILRAQPGAGWRIAGRALVTPPLRGIAAACYRLVSRYRRRLPGSTCAAPPGAAPAADVSEPGLDR